MTKDLWPKCKGLAVQGAVRQQIAEDRNRQKSRSPYPDAINLPFNHACISSGFEFLKSGDRQPADDCIWAIIQGNNVVIVESGSGATLPAGPLPEWLVHHHQPPLLIGAWQGKALFAISVSSSLQLQPPFFSEPFNSNAERLDIRSLTLAGLARQILHWELQSRHCPRCGAQTERLSGSWGKRCGSCKNVHFPHIHPCAIILVKHGDRLLLTRKAEWVPGRYSLVAGFLDFGESLEECAIREVREETGIEICNVRYVGSQNWPFPSQLMAGFVADYAGGEIEVDTSELEDAGWFGIDALPALPPLRSIARWIIDNFK
ncbi:MAG TPA: NAD(+) diphosphatase [Geobacter sp.]|nr:NAD(+) diphosphatase [Geobacter sp.]HCE69301.1 NAD(+) diphosphatase [Geobacter sp.]